MARQSVSTEETNKAMGDQGNGLPLWKRLLDLGIIMVLLPGPVLVGGAVAFIVAFGSPGPVLFRQRRVGYKGRQFVCFKFRTMHVGAETDSHKGHTTHLIKSGGAMTKLDTTHDPRLIPLGKLIRASGLDELPQLINVLRGEMSLVGPRPCIPYEYEMYDPGDRRRFEATPGLTGLWQVSGKNRTTFAEMINLDVKYAQEKNLWLDLKIIFKTLPALWQQCQDVRAAKNDKEAPPSKTGMAKPVQSYQA